MIGRTIGKYRFVGQIGRGATGTVYKAIDETLNRDVAIKILNPDFAETDLLTRFRVEATILARLNHPEIAVIHELFRSETDLLMVMEFVRGETLEKLSDRLGPMPPNRAAYLIDKILSALEHAHRVGIVHRDMKPANVMVTDIGGVKIMDFGIARVRGTEQITVVGSMMGTPAYMPPEQVLGQQVDGRADLYSVGVVFYRLLTGALPFQADNAISMLQRHVADRPTPLERHRQGLPDWCEAIVQRALAKSPDDRFQTAEEFREALGRATGMIAAMDLAKWFAVAEHDATGTPAPSPIADTVVLSRDDAALSAPVAAGPAMPAATKPQSTPLPAGGGAGTPSSKAATIVLHKRSLSWTPGTLAVLTAGAALLASLTLDRPAMRSMPAAATAATALPTLVFEATALMGTSSRPREAGVRLVLDEGTIVLRSGADDSAPALRAVPYRNVMSIAYSRGRDPMWNSPEGPAAIVHAGRPALELLGIAVVRHWIALETNTEDATTGSRFIVMSLDDGLVRTVLSALEERTGRAAQIIGQRKAAD
jgi:predicted Ser/Thr protein kinase